MNRIIIIQNGCFSGITRTHTADDTDKRERKRNEWIIIPKYRRPKKEEKHTTRDKQGKKEK